MKKERRKIYIDFANTHFKNDIIFENFDFGKSDFKGAQFLKKAQFLNCDLSKVKNLTLEQIEKITIDENTKLPNMKKIKKYEQI